MRISPLLLACGLGSTVSAFSVGGVVVVDGRPLPNARVSLVGQEATTRTHRFGQFRIDTRSDGPSCPRRHGWRHRKMDTLLVYAEGQHIAKFPVRDGDRFLYIRLPGAHWVSGDFHTHTFLSDGSHTQADVVANAFGGTYPLLDAKAAKTKDTTVAGYGLDWMMNTDHGGSFDRNPLGIQWDSTDVSPLGAPPAHRLWRWQSLFQHSWPIVDSLRHVYRDKQLVQGFEWNVPTHEHASLGILASDPKAISTFEYLFDESDKDTSSTGGKAFLAPNAPKSPESSHAKAVAGVAWLQANHADDAFMILNHPSRKLKYGISDIRDFLDAGPDVFLGIEAMPGHQKESPRGGYGTVPKNKADSVKARTYGGADYMLAKVGGLADAIWSEGRKFWIYSNSDFHVWDATSDFYPGEYSVNRTLSADRSMAQILQGLRSGTGYCQTGDLVSHLDFVADDGIQAARMGGTLQVDSADSVTLVVHYVPSTGNRNGDLPVLHHIDILAGAIGDKASSGSPQYAVDTVSTTRIIKTLFASDFRRAGRGTLEARVKVKASGSAYYRLRGTNLPPSTPGETDPQGNPLGDFGANTEAGAWADLWVYTNPVFVLR